MFESIQINPWGCLAGGVCVFAFGGLWFSPVMFSKSWSENVVRSGLSMGKPALALPVFLAASIALAFLEAVLFSMAGWDTAGKGIVGGLLFGALVSLTALSDVPFTSLLRASWWWNQLAFRILAMVLLGLVVGASAPETHRFDRAFDEAGKAIEKSLGDLGK